MWHYTSMGRQFVLAYEFGSLFISLWTGVCPILLPPFIMYK